LRLDEFDTSLVKMLRPLSEEEYRQLKANIQREGIREPVIYAEIGGRKVLLDGYHRLRIADELGLPVKFSRLDIRTMEDAEAWVYTNQLGRRNLSPTEAAYYRGRLYQLMSKRGVGLSEVAKAAKVSKATINRDALFALAVDTLAGIGGPEVRSKILSGEIGSRRDVQYLAKLAQKDPKVIEKLAKGELTARQALLRLARETRPAEAGKEPPGARLICDDFRNVQLEKESVSLILTDPPYGNEYLGLWDGLGEKASEWLRPGGFLVCYAGQAYLPDVLAMLRSRLKYWWTMALVFASAGEQGWSRDTRLIARRGIYNAWKPIIIFAKGEAEIVGGADDVLFGAGREKSNHEWEQSSLEAEALIKIFSQPGDLVVDPMMGSGSVVVAAVKAGRRAVGIDISPENVEIARSRLASG
jgi:ParB-like chromosome segregation protein Spo0J